MAQPYYPMYGTSAAMPTPITGTMDGSSTTPYTAMYGSNLVVDDDVSEDGSRKKKVKTILPLLLAPLMSYHSAQKIVCQ